MGIPGQPEALASVPVPLPDDAPLEPPDAPPLPEVVPVPAPPPVPLLRPPAPVEPPVEPIPELLRAYRAKEEWLEGRVVITPHSAWLTPQSWIDTRRKSAETMRAALLTNNPQNVIAPDMF